MTVDFITKTSTTTVEVGAASRGELEHAMRAQFPAQFVELGMYQLDRTIWEGASVIVRAVVREGGTTGGRVLACIRGSR